MSKPIVVVGVDGSDAATDALRWAIDCAEAHGGTVRAVSAWNVPTFGGPMAEPTAPVAGPDLAQAAADAIEHSLSQLDRVPASLERVVVHGDPVALLEQMGAEPDVVMVVVGRRGLGRLATVLLGSTSRALIHGAPCPVAVVPRGKHDHGGPTLVGVDGSPGALAALRWADRWGGPHIIAVHAWRVHYFHNVPMLPRSEFAEMAQARLEKTQREFEAGPPAHATQIDYRLTEGDARSMLVSRHASMLVVGKCHGLPARMVGSVAAAVTVRSSIPVIVTPPTE
ncbi:MAG: universal stress protein [Acidimicrobiales bacterium]|nr:universal stress protein [Acidimicrobiales bacterium]